MKQINGKFQIKFENQFYLLLSLIILFYGYFGIISNRIMVDELGHQLVYTQIDSRVIIWNFLLYPRVFYLPLILLICVSFIYSFLQNIPEIGIKGAIWFVPFIIACSFHWYSKINSPFTPAISLLVDGNSGSLFQYIGTRFVYVGEAFSILFTHWQGYVMIMILYVSSIVAAIGGKFLKKMIVSRRNKILNSNLISQESNSQASLEDL